MESAARRGRKRRRMLDFVRTGAAIVAVIGVLLSLMVDPMIIGIVLLLAGGATFLRAHDGTKVRDELEIDQIDAARDAMIQRNLRALDDFRIQIASNELRCEERTPDGTVKPLSPNMRRAFLADHGALLVLTREQGLWQCIPHRPIPMSALWVRLGSRVASVLITSRTLLDTADCDLFDRRMEWLLSRAEKAGAKANSFREAVQMIVALRRPDLDGLTFERKKELLCAEGFGESRMEKIHAGIYPAFNNFLRSLPMHEFP